jgi:3-hydroxyacyl-[acyl-carrier-protein] dehydratase
MRWLWIDRIVELEPRKRLVAIKNISLAEDHLHDHFPGAEGRPALPIMPASLIVEGMAQTAGILVGHAEGFREKVILAKVSKAELSREALPGQTLRYEATIERIDSVGASTRGVVELLDHSSTSVEAIGEINLIFSHIDRNMGGMAFPKDNFVFGDAFKTVLRSSGIEVE